jgi:hypothetical protein
MRVTILSLFLYGITALCQSSAPAPIINKLPPGWRAIPPADPKVMMVPNAPDTTRLSNAEIIVHPPPSSIGVQPPGTAVTQKDEYPDLRIRPMELNNSALEAIPTTWPRYRLETIPTQWPMHEMVPVRSGFEVTAHPPGN